MDYTASKLLGLLTTTGSLLMLALLAGTFLLWSRRWRLGRVLLSAIVLGLAALIFLPIQPAITGMLENRFQKEPPLPDHIDGIIVLGGMVRPETSRARGRLTLNDAAERLFEGAHLAHLHPEAKVLFTGGSPDPWDQEAREADFAGKALIEMGVDPARLIIEDRSRNTYENAVFSLPLAPDGGKGTWILVTSAIHLPRSVGVFRKAGWNIIPWPCNYLTGGEPEWTNEDVAISRLYFLSRTGHELVGMLYYRLRGWSDELFPSPN
jgi:uncharacterized SAM-binding protein YcdF (DUF218 family)